MLAAALGNRAFARAVLQRKIGFEIETALPASRAVQGEDEALRVREVRQDLRHQLIADVKQKYADRERVWPKQRMHDGPGWYATADNTDRLGDGSKVNVELVTDPPLPTGNDKVAELKAAVDHVKSMQDWAQGFAATAGARRTGVGGEYAIGFPSATQVTRLGNDDPAPVFRPGPALGGVGATTAWSTANVCTLTLTNGADTITVSQGPKKQLDVKGVRAAKKNVNLNIAKCKGSLTDAGLLEATTWIRHAVNEVVRPPDRPQLPGYDRGLTNTDGYVQVNVGVGLGNIRAMQSYEALQNPPRSAEKIAQQQAPQVVDLLQPLLPAVPRLDLEGLARLLGALVIGGRDYPVKELIKNMWGALNKSELHSWWKLHLTTIGHDTGDKYLERVPALVDAVSQGLGVPQSNRLMFKYDAKDIAKVSQFANLADLTVGQYLTEVLSFTADKLTTGALAHRETTVGKNSVIGAETVSGDTGEPGSPPVGVIELRNINTFWTGGKWAEEERLRPYLDMAYMGARKPAG